MNAALKVTTSTEYAAGRPRCAITRPPIAGPAISVVWNRTMLSESAPGRRSTPTRFGMIAVRVGESTAPTSAASATTA